MPVLGDVKPVAARLYARTRFDVPPPTGLEHLGACWMWLGQTLKKGYSRIKVRAGKMALTHRVSYEYLVSSIPEDAVLDHLCRAPACCNPAHLEPVTNKENIMRGVGICANNNRKTHCKRGHEFTAENTYSQPGHPANHRSCRQCKKEVNRMIKVRKKLNRSQSTT